MQVEPGPPDTEVMHPVQQSIADVVAQHDDASVSPRLDGERIEQQLVVLTVDAGLDEHQMADSEGGGRALDLGQAPLDRPVVPGTHRRRCGKDVNVAVPTGRHAIAIAVFRVRPRALGG